MMLDKIIAVKDVACHCYDGSQCEHAILAKTAGRKGYRWYVGYGADYLPASRADLDNMREYTYQAQELADKQESMIGKTVIMYRDYR